jgi:asparagine synthase (glutamine-hydrolysing)
MCGICGFIKFNEPVREEDSNIIKRMNAKLFHRGPDAQDTLLFDNIALGFSRLSIIGLGNGMQPISNEDDTVFLICNGEIFNYIELREELRKKGHTFKTGSDVEVILHLYEEKGMDFLNELNGQFAFTLYDKKNRTLFGARDQMGILPFFYTSVNNVFIFASEIKAILEHPLVVKEVDIVGLDQVLTFAGLVSPRTMFKGVKSLENGHYLEVDSQGKISNKEYWDLVFKEGKIESRPESYYIEQFDQLFNDAVKLRLRADVPSGYYLSGGLDSSTIAMKIRQLNPGVRKEAFSIDFADAEISESGYQEIVANQGNSIYNKKIFYYKDISERLRKAIYHCECPIKETYNTASISLSESVKAKGIKVILSGEGADELFAGYVGYKFDKMRALNLIQNESSLAEQKIRKRLWGNKSFYYERNFTEHNLVKKALYSDQVNAMFDEVDCLNYDLIDSRKIHNRDILQQRSYIDFKIRMVDHLISDHGDRMAMANSIEVRYPFLDKNIVEFATEVPSDLKLNDFNEKYILKKMAGRYVPRQIIDREKFGFVAPGSPYLLQNNCEYINDLLSFDLIKKQGYFNPHHIEALKKMYGQEGFKVNVPFETDLLIIVTTFGILLDTFFEN